MLGSRSLAALAVAAAVWLPFGAQAQYYGAPPQGAPLYPYTVDPSRPYAVEVAPGTYVIRRPVEAQAYPQASRAHRVRADKRKVTRNDPAMIEELRQRHAGKSSARNVETEVINTKKIVRGKPIVVETTRVVDDPPKVIVRKRYVDDNTASLPSGKQTVTIEDGAKIDGTARDDGKKRVIEADAEVTIIGPDRMSIRLFRKRGAQVKANAEAEE
ncbi:hypothetical protein MXD81_42745 [Microbacteriaceae bacterium K1510]|nr:hypothetical protein [Microbacteriaceae bacterium K1510]